MLFRYLLFSLVLFFSTLGVRAQVEASLVAADTAIRPGEPVVLALRLEHKEHWHSYWVNAGTGYPTKLTWNLPAGWTASEIHWPAPSLVRDTAGTITGYGYEGVVYLPVTLTPPAGLRAGTTVSFAAEAKWLMCAEVCVPGKAQVRLSLPVTEAASVPDPAHGAAVAAALAAVPTPDPGLTLAATSHEKTVTLSVASPAGRPAAEAGTPWFFSRDGSIQFDAPQSARRGPSGGWLIDLPVSTYAEKAPERLVGVLRFDGVRSGGISVDVPVSPAGAAVNFAVTRAVPEAAVEVGTLPGALALAFVGGLILNLMPCVFPVLGIKILGFVNQAGADRRKVTLHGLAFAGGVFVSFWALAGALAVLRAGGGKLGWGFQLQSPAFVYTLAAVMLVFALSMSGVFEFGLRATGVGAGLQRKDGFAGSFFTGVLATVVATPCSAPFLAPALGAALALPVAESFAVFTAIAAGLSLPYLLLSLFPQAVKLLPRPGAWMETFRQAMAFPLYATVGYLVWVLAGQLKADDTALLSILVGLTVVALGVWFYGRYSAPGARPARARAGLVGGVLLVALGAWLGWPRSPAPSAITWRPWSAEAVAKAVAEGKPVYVDFTARWCFTCQTNKKIVFGSSEVLRTFRDKGVVTLRADWTDEDPLITAELAKWGRSAVPFNLVYLPGKTEPAVLPELLTPGIVLDALASRTQ